MKKLYQMLLTLSILLVTQQLTANENTPVHLTASNTLSTLVQSKNPVLIKFWAPWCKPCITMTPKYRETAQKFTGKVMFTELNIDDYPSIASKYNVKSIPTLILFENNKIVERVSGVLSRNDIEEFIHSGL